MTPETLRMPYREVVLETPDGIELGAWWMEQTVRGKSSSKCVLCFNPYNHDKSRMLGLARGLWESGYSVMLFDFRSHAIAEHQWIRRLDIWRRWTHGRRFSG